MAGSKRMSADEKRQTILQIYHSTKAVYTEKEILTLAAKEGINANTIADTNNALVDDGLVDKEKIGGINYFWSFPAKKDRQMQLQHQQRLQNITKLQQQVLQVESQLADAKRGRQDDDDDDDGTTSRATKLIRLTDLTNETTKLQAELDVLKENDPQAVADLQHELQLVTQAAHRWTDNIFNCKTYLVKKRGMDRKQADKLLGISSDFDYPEDKIPK